MTGPDDIVPSVYWLSLEAPVSIVSICLPSMFSLARRGVYEGAYALFTRTTGSPASDLRGQEIKIPNIKPDHIEGHSSIDRPSASANEVNYAIGRD